MSVSATAVAPVFDKTPTAQVSQIQARDKVNDHDQDDMASASAPPPPAKPPEGMGQVVDKMV
ncbi:MAG: hypothetical protein JWN71_4984 [Xanthobacteraceae bacterium]|jgi:hypothetical protein|nr:hypothetical protein [Xanthobacteraceae bacterium]